ncbi:hypothetical protein NXC14_PC00694 (plasmid) [Rhizobium sp. NXC14]|nr:hypothetical protein NXC14_PC00694 [Rhizobium sp. NXC14]
MPIPGEASNQLLTRRRSPSAASRQARQRQSAHAAELSKVAARFAKSSAASPVSCSKPFGGAGTVGFAA